MLVSGHTTRRPRSRIPQVRFARQGFITLSFKIAVLACLLPALLAISPHPQVGAEGAGYVDTDVLNLREDAGTWASVITQMYQGESVTVLDGPTDDGWYQVDYLGSVGWAFGGYLQIDGAPGWSDWVESGVGGMASTAWVNTETLNIRADASLDAWVMDRFAQGDEVTVVGGEVNGFVPVDVHGQRGYVWSEYLSWDGPASAGPERWIDVNRSSQTVSLMSGDEVIASYWGAIGWDESDDGFYSTAIGTYYVYGKHADLAWTEWGQAYIMSWVGFDPARVNGFHSFSMDENGKVLPNGDGKTGGCVALEPSAAAIVYDFASYGMRVEIHR
jgi:uncharacterized protein YgiM (DUF1202 family)